MASIRENIAKYIKKKYKASPEYLWKRYPDYAVFRHDDNRKWFAIIMDVEANKLGRPGTERIDIIDVKIDDLMLRDILLKQEGFLPAYHMNKGSWITILLDGSVSQDEICTMIDASFLDTASKKKKDKFRQPKEWIVPANPKYYDIEHAFDDTDEIDWKQGAGIIKGDTVFMYVGSPVSAILYKCKVTEIDIPYDYEDKNLKITALMKIKLQKRYEPDKFTFDRLKSEYGIYAVRGPRGIPNSLSAALKEVTMKILLVEDEKRMSEALCEIFRQEKYDTDVFPDGISGLDAARSGIYDLLILDVMLPGINGFDIVRTVRKEGIQTPVLMLTARSDIDDKVSGLDSGADDYLTKPFETKELLARVRALLRRNNIQKTDDAGNLVLGDLKLDSGKSMLFNTENGMDVRLSEKELHIMEIFLANEGAIIGKEQLAVKIWGFDNEAEYNNVEVYISFTRKKLQFLASKMEIKAVRGLGYELRKKE